jgi:hypothetical protein
VIREAIDAVAAKAVATANPQARVYQPPHFPRSHYLQTEADGSVSTRQVPFGPPSDVLGHFAAVAAWLAGVPASAAGS